MSSAILPSPDLAPLTSDYIGGRCFAKQFLFSFLEKYGVTASRECLIISAMNAEQLGQELAAGVQFFSPSVLCNQGVQMVPGGAVLFDRTIRSVAKFKLTLA